jgi:hypothetical protein
VELLLIKNISTEILRKRETAYRQIHSLLAEFVKKRKPNYQHPVIWCKYREMAAFLHISCGWMVGFNQTRNLPISSIKI